MFIKIAGNPQTLIQKEFLNYICENFLPNAFYRLPHSLSFLVVHFDVAV